MGRWLWQIKKAVGALWFRASIFGTIAVLTAFIAYYSKDIIPDDFSQKIGAEAVDSLLNIIATTMLAVTTFSLSTMVAAYSAATNNVTPRSTRLLLQDSVSQNVLSTFLGAFIFSLVGIIALKIGIYGEGGRLILFVVTIIVLVILVATLIRWIEYLSRLGRVSETINLVENVAVKATRERLNNLYLGGVRLGPSDAVPQDAMAVYPPRSGYVQFIDMDMLSAVAEKEDCKIYVRALPGAMVHAHRELALVVGGKRDAYEEKIQNAFIVQDDRTFEQDPRFGMVVLSEIASRALSPAVNDPGTAIDVIWTSMRVLSLWLEDKEEEPETKHPAVFVPPLTHFDLLQDAYLPIARDGAGTREVCIALQKALGVLAASGDAEMKDAASRISAAALRHAEQALALREEYDEISALADKISQND